MAEGNKDVANLMNMIASVEKTHAQLYDKTMRDLAAGQDCLKVIMYVLFADI